MVRQKSNTQNNVDLDHDGHQSGTKPHLVAKVWLPTLVSSL